MKTPAKINQFLKSLFAASLFFTAMIANAETPKEKSSAANASRTIREYFKFPGILIPQHDNQKLLSNRIEVLFITGINGEVNFVLAKTNDNELKQEIEKQFKNLCLRQLKPEVVHSVVLNFRTI